MDGDGMNGWKGVKKALMSRTKENTWRRQREIARMRVEKSLGMGIPTLFDVGGR